MDSSDAGSDLAYGYSVRHWHQILKEAQSSSAMGGARLMSAEDELACLEALKAYLNKGWFEAIERRINTQTEVKHRISKRERDDG